jgi:hypothetical protein
MNPKTRTKEASMEKRTVLTGAALASLTLAACASPKTAQQKPAMDQGAGAMVAAKGECWGVNACKGQGACGSAGQGCAGTNECKGKGWLTLSKPECDAKSGTFKAQ